VATGGELTCFECQGLNVQHDDLDALFGEVLDHVATDAACPSGDQNDFLVPVILVGLPVVHDPIGEVAAQPTGNGDVKQRLDPRIRQRMQNRHVLALLSEPGQEDEGQEKCRIHRCTADDLQDGITPEPFAR
jgi:hypothetical protein